MAKTDPNNRYVIREYYDDSKKLDSRWYYDYEISRNGPVLVENFDLPKKEKKTRAKKVAN